MGVSLIDKVEIVVDNIEEMCVHFNYDVFDLTKLITHVFIGWNRKKRNHTCAKRIYWDKLIESEMQKTVPMADIRVNRVRTKIQIQILD